MSKKNEKGFTLIELLVVVAIIGILAAIAIPQFASYRANSFCARVESDVTNAMIAAEAYYAEDPARGYPATTADASFTTSDGVTVTYGGAGTAASPFEAVGTHTTACPKGTYTVVQGAQPAWS